MTQEHAYMGVLAAIKQSFVMAQVRLIIFLLLVFNGQLKAQSFKEQYRECSKALNGAGIGDTAYWRSIKQVYGCMKGVKAPEFSITTLEGKLLSLTKLKGQVIVINFWNTQCKPCIAEMPALNEITEKYKGQNVTFISATYENERMARAFLKTHTFLFQNAADAEKLISNEFLTNDVYPYSIIIDKQGRVSKIMIGGSFDRNDTFQQFVPSIDECLVKVN